MPSWPTMTSAETPSCSSKTNGHQGMTYHPRLFLVLEKLTVGNRLPPQGRSIRPTPRSRSNTVRSHTQYVEPAEEAPVVDVRPSIKSARSATSRSVENPLSDYSPSISSSRPGYIRSTTFDSPRQVTRELSPVTVPRMTRVPSDSLMVRTARSNLRNLDEGDIFADDSGSYTNSSPDHGYGESVSPATSQGSGSFTPLKKTTAPPPPPSRAKKPPPPPIPAKRTMIT